MSWKFLEEKEEEKWNNFVEKEEESRFIHLTPFKRVIRNVYKFEPLYLYYKKGEDIYAIFSSFIQSSILSGKRILSQPFSEYGGLLFSKNLNENEKIEILEELFFQLKKIMEKEEIRGAEIRGKVDNLVEKFCKKTILGKYGIKKLEGNLDLWKSVDYMVRKAFKKAEREGLEIFEDGNFDRIRDFYRLHIITMKRLGSPPHPISYFIALRNELLDKIKIIYAIYKGRIISALLGWKVGRSIHITDAPSEEKFFHLRGNDFLHYKLMEWAKDNGYKIFDFGPMRYKSQEFYKVKWGIESYEYSIYHFPEKILSIAYKTPFYVKFAREVWKLIPVSFSKHIGKFLRRELGL